MNTKVDITENEKIWFQDLEKHGVIDLMQKEILMDTSFLFPYRNNNQAVWIGNKEGITIWANEAFLELIGAQELEELRNKKKEEFWPDDDNIKEVYKDNDRFDSSRDLIEKINEKELESNKQYRVHIKDLENNLVPVKVSNIPLGKSNDALEGWTSELITSLKSEKELEESKNKEIEEISKTVDVFETLSSFLKGLLIIVGFVGLGTTGGILLSVYQNGGFEKENTQQVQELQEVIEQKQTRIKELEGQVKEPEIETEIKERYFVSPSTTIEFGNNKTTLKTVTFEQRLNLLDKDREINIEKLGADDNFDKTLKLEQMTNNVDLVFKNSDTLKLERQGQTITTTIQRFLENFDENNRAELYIREYNGVPLISNKSIVIGELYKLLSDMM